MKIEKIHTINLFDVDHRFKLKIQSAAQLFQEMATFHSTQIGVGSDVLLEKGVIWILHRLEMEFFSYPKLGDKIKLVTWSRGFKGYKGYREYLIQSSKGEIARGSSVWLFFDLKKKRISKVPVQISKQYTIEDDKWFDNELDDWKACGKIKPEKQMDISLRYSDFDVIGHVNNTIYIGFLETLYHGTTNSRSRPVRNIKIRFCREIDRTKKNVKTGWVKKNGVYLCNIFDESMLFADAQIIVHD
ncbi:MAG: hypothetical protein GY857_08385 [Desulfobacula sp.]|nr:hypothetical protein [Desulfobacula sp.]